MSQEIKYELRQEMLSQMTPQLRSKILAKLQSGEKIPSEMHNNLHDFGRCYKDNRKALGKGAAYEKCNDVYAVEDEIEGEVLPDGIPQHDVYNLKVQKLQEAERKIGLLIEESGYDFRY